MIAYYITYDGGVRKYYYGRAKVKLFNTEKYGFINYFRSKYDALSMRDVIEANYPKAFLHT
jgi:hypothetical protein